MIQLEHTPVLVLQGVPVYCQMEPLLMHLVDRRTPGDNVRHVRVVVDLVPAQTIIPLNGVPENCQTDPLFCAEYRFPPAVI
jgi:hypothetical protein